MEKKRQ